MTGPQDLKVMSDKCMEPGCKRRIMHVSGMCPDHRPKKLFKCTYRFGESEICNRLVHEKTRRHQRIYCEECNAKFIARKKELNDKFRLRAN